jgi:hypothetical protein
MATSKVFLSASRDGKVERPCAFVKGPLAVARPIGDDKTWMIGHVASGMSCGGIRYRSMQRAKAALRDMLPLTDWTDARLSTGDAKFLGKEVFHKILAVAAKHGGVNLFGMPIRPQEFNYNV